MTTNAYKTQLRIRLGLGLMPTVITAVTVRVRVNADSNGTATNYRWSRADDLTTFSVLFQAKRYMLLHQSQ